MFVTPEFIFIHLSKTGGTFVEDTLKKIFCHNIFLRAIYALKRRYDIKIPLFPYRFTQYYQHALCNNIPAQDSHKQIVSIIRNPYELYVSEYTFEWWNKYADQWFWDLNAVKKKYPKFPQLDFREFLDASWEFASWVNRTFVRHPNTRGLGWYSHKFVYYYCRDHDYVFDAAGDDQLFLERVKEKMHDIYFLRQDQLNKDLFHFLLFQGYPRERIEHILYKDRVNVSRSKRSFLDFYDDELKNEVRQRESLIFELFPEYDK